jgi:hypothetical protein
MRGSTFWFLLFGLVFRITAASAPPSFSDDLYRYRWEGKLQTAGGNPYLARPVDPEWSHLRDRTFDRVALPDFKGGYGPLWMLAERGTYELVSRLTSDPERQVFLFKMPAVLAELILLLVMPALLAAWHRPSWGVLLYAWNPLLIFEFWAEGHNDAWPVLAVGLAFLAAAKNRWSLAFLSLSLGVAAKYWPILLLLPFAGWRERRWQALLVFPVMALCFAPFWTNLLDNARFMTGFVGGWRNNDALFGAVFWATGNGNRAKDSTFLVIGALILAVTWRRWPLPEGALAILAGTLLLSSNIHPWYLTWYTPLLSLVPCAPLLLWQGLIPLAYAVRIDWELLHEWIPVRPERWWIHAPVLGWLAWKGLVRILGRRRPVSRTAP